jgi:hypothetical protein
MVPAVGTPFVGLQTRFPGNSSSHGIAAFDFPGSHRTHSCPAECCARSQNLPRGNESRKNCPHTYYSLAVYPTPAAFAWVAFLGPSAADPPLRSWPFGQSKTVHDSHPRSELAWRAVVGGPGWVGGSVRLFGQMHRLLCLLQRDEHGIP